VTDTDRQTRTQGRSHSTGASMASRAKKTTERRTTETIGAPSDEYPESVAFFRERRDRRTQTLAVRSFLAAETTQSHTHIHSLFYYSPSSVTMGWLLSLVTGAPLVVGASDSSRVLSD